MYFRIPLLSLLLGTVSMVTREDDSLEEKIPHDSPVAFKCSNVLVRTAPQQSENHAFKELCYPIMDKYWDCLQPDIYKSNFSIDIDIRTITDFARAKTATKTLCENALKLPGINQTYGSAMRECRKSTSQSPNETIKDSARLCQADDRRCMFNIFAKSELRAAVLYGKYHEERMSNGCLLSDPKFRLVPSYGPELKCYSSINIDEIDPTDYGRIYERYCEQFNYTTVSTCVEESLSDVTSEDLWQDKESYINEARWFVRDKRAICDNLATLPSLKCSNPTYKPDVGLCQNPLFIPPGPTKYRAVNAMKMYAVCIKLIYAPCNYELGLLIYRNLMTYT